MLTSERSTELLKSTGYAVVKRASATVEAAARVGAAARLHEVVVVRLALGERGKFLRARTRRHERLGLVLELHSRRRRMVCGRRQVAARVSRRAALVAARRLARARVFDAARSGRSRRMNEQRPCARARARPGVAAPARPPANRAPLPPKKCGSGTDTSSRTAPVDLERVARPAWPKRSWREQGGDACYVTTKAGNRILRGACKMKPIIDSAVPLPGADRAGPLLRDVHVPARAACRQLLAWGRDR